MTVLMHPTESENLVIESERACARPSKDLYQFCSFSGLFTRLGYILLKGNPNVKGWSETGETGTMSGVAYMCFRHWHASRTRFNIVLGPVRQTGSTIATTWTPTPPELERHASRTVPKKIFFSMLGRFPLESLKMNVKLELTPV